MMGERIRQAVYGQLADGINAIYAEAEDKTRNGIALFVSVDGDETVGGGVKLSASAESAEIVIGIRGADAVALHEDVGRSSGKSKFLEYIWLREKPQLLQKMAMAAKEALEAKRTPL